MKKKLLLAICLMASVSGYAQWWSGHAENVVFDEAAKKMTITGLIAGHLDKIITDGTEGTNGTTNYRKCSNASDMETAPIQTLIITGDLYGKDLHIIAEMCRFWYDGNAGYEEAFLAGGLKNLDISAANIVKDELNSENNIYFKTKDHAYNNVSVSDCDVGDTQKLGGYSGVLDLSDDITLKAENNIVGPAMFIGCNSLETIKMPSTVTEIGQGAFAFLKRTSEVLIPASVTKIGSYCFWQAFNLWDGPTAATSNPDWGIKAIPVTIIKFEGAEDLITLEPNALKHFNTTNRAVARVITPLSQLGDYAVDKGDGEDLILKENIDAGELKATATPPNKYWTFSCGVDIVLPDNIKAYTCRIVNGETDIVELTNAQLDADEDGKRVIPANNGVLLACPDNAESNAYDMVVQYNAGITAIATEDAKTWGDQNALVPVIRKAHYNPGDYYMLYHGKWVVLASDAEQVPAGKALLKK